MLSESAVCCMGRQCDYGTTSVLFGCFRITQPLAPPGQRATTIAALPRDNHVADRLGLGDAFADERFVAQVRARGLPGQIAATEARHLRVDLCLHRGHHQRVLPRQQAAGAQRQMSRAVAEHDGAMRFDLLVGNRIR